MISSEQEKRTADRISGALEMAMADINAGKGFDKSVKKAAERFGLNATALAKRVSRKLNNKQ